MPILQPKYFIFHPIWEIYPCYKAYMYRIHWGWHSDFIMMFLLEGGEEGRGRGGRYGGEVRGGGEGGWETLSYIAPLYPQFLLYFLLQSLPRDHNFHIFLGYLLKNFRINLKLKISPQNVPRLLSTNLVGTYLYHVPTYKGFKSLDLFIDSISEECTRSQELDTESFQSDSLIVTGTTFINKT